MLQCPVSSTFWISVSDLQPSSEASRAHSDGDVVAGKLKGFNAFRNNPGATEDGNTLICPASCLFFFSFIEI